MPTDPENLAHAETVLSPCLTPTETNLKTTPGQEEQEVQADLLKLQLPSKCTGVSTSAGQHRRRGLMLAVAEMPTDYSTPSALAPVPIINQSVLPFIPVPVLLTVVSLLNISAEYLPVTLSLFLCCHSLQYQLPILQASLCSQLPGPPCAVFQPVLSFSKGTIERTTSSLG